MPLLLLIGGVSFTGGWWAASKTRDIALLAAVAAGAYMVIKKG